MKATTKITCNQCPALKIIKRKIMDKKRIDRRTWVFYCTGFKGDLFMGVIETKNQDLHNKELPDIIPPFVCKRRQEARKAGIENKFELQIN